MTVKKVIRQFVLGSCLTVVSLHVENTAVGENKVADLSLNIEDEKLCALSDNCEHGDTRVQFKPAREP